MHPRIYMLRYGLVKRQQVTHRYQPFRIFSSQATAISGVIYLTQKFAAINSRNDSIELCL